MPDLNLSSLLKYLLQKVNQIRRTSIFSELPPPVTLTMQPDIEKIKRALAERKLFKLDKSYVFALAIPNHGIYWTSARCSNCTTETDYYTQICSYCGFPFVGPVNDTLMRTRWASLFRDKKLNLVTTIFNSRQRGRVLNTKCENIPLSAIESRFITTTVNENQREIFRNHHKIDPWDLVEKLDNLNSLFENELAVNQ